MTDYSLKELKIEVTHQCPLACLHCSSVASIENQDAMSLDKCLLLLSEAADLKVQDIAFSGGEPLIWDGICDTVKTAHSYGMRTTIYTSGNVGNNQDARKVFEELKISGLDRAIFSLYSPKEEDHNRITRKLDSFRNTLNSIDICCSLDISPEVHFVALSDNYSLLPELIALVESHGVSKTSVLRLVPQGRGKVFSKTHTMNKQQNLALKQEINRLRTEGHIIRTGSPFNVLWLNETPQCPAAQDRMIVTPDLRVYPCDAFKQVEAEEIVSSPKYTTLADCSLKECWEKSDYFNTIRNAIMIPPTPPCNECPTYSQCGSGCLAQKFIYHGSLEKNPDPACLRGTIV